MSLHLFLMSSLHGRLFSSHPFPIFLSFVSSIRGVHGIFSIDEGRWPRWPELFVCATKGGVHVEGLDKRLGTVTACFYILVCVLSSSCFVSVLLLSCFLFFFHLCSLICSLALHTPCSARLRYPYGAELLPGGGRVWKHGDEGDLKRFIVAK